MNIKKAPEKAGAATPKDDHAPMNTFNWDKNGQDWCELEKFPLCKDGCKQSPINVEFGGT